jgi:hypothetical protein
MKNLRLVVINTTAYSEENLSLITDLTDEQIIEVVTPIVEEERNNDDEYDNDDLVIALINKFHQTNYIQQVIDADEVTI